MYNIQKTIWRIVAIKIGKQSKLLFGKLEDIAKHRIPTIRNKSNVFYNEVEKGPNSDGFKHGDQDSLKLYNGSEIVTYNSDPKKNVGVRCNLIVSHIAIAYSNVCVKIPF